MTSLILRTTLRRLWRTPAFCALLIVLIAGTIAVNAAVGGAIYASRWKPLPYPESDRLMAFKVNLEKFGFVMGASFAVFDELAADTDTFDSVAAYAPNSTTMRVSDGDPWQMLAVTANLPATLGLAPLRGTSLDANVPDGVVISYHAWQTRLGADPAVVGRTIALRDGAKRVLGVMPPDFAFPDTKIEAWYPLARPSADAIAAAQGSVGDLEMIGRIKPGKTFVEAAGRYTNLLATNAGLAQMRAATGLKAEPLPLRDLWRNEGLRSLYLLQWAALLLFVVVAANLINLVLERTLRRGRELAVRSALGASRAEGLMQAGLEVAVLAAIGSVIGLCTTPWGLNLLREQRLLPRELPFDLGLDIAGFITAGALLTLLVLAAVFAAWLLLRADGIGRQLQTRAASSRAGRVRAILIVAQIVLTTALLGASGLLLRSATRLLAEDVGFDRERVIVSDVDLDPESQGPRKPDANTSALYRARVERLRQVLAALPGIERVSTTNMAPFTQSESVSNLTAPDGTDVQARMFNVGAEFATTLGARLIAGRDISPQDAEGLTALVDRQFVRRYLGDRPPETAVGQTFKMTDNDADAPREITIVGVIATFKHRALDENDPMASIFVRRDPAMPQIVYMLRTAPGAFPAAATVSRALTQADPGVAVRSSMALTGLIARSVEERQAVIRAIGAFAFATLLLAGVGLYALMAFAVRRRFNEWGVRLALGATPARVRGQVVGEGMRLAAWGLVAGAFVGVVLAWSALGGLYKTMPYDPVTWIVVAALVLTAMLLGCWRPAQQAARTSPQQCLREEA